ncbi:MAG: T9SS type A sorting domain-containing protein [Bacteroidetes bacterium]|nr:T9SS type A sorting domain-containing protein [Bacteroidota bacterium]
MRSVLHLKLQIIGNENYVLYSLQGQLLLNNEVEDNSQFNASNIPTGLIIYSIVSGLNVIQTGKVLIY